MAATPSIIISQDDFQKISALLTLAKDEVAELLEEELARAELMAVDQLPKDIVTMNSEVTFVDLDTNKEQTLTLVYPNEADIKENKVSILAPMGAALIGLRVGQTMDWRLFQNKLKRIKISSVSYPQKEELLHR